MKTLIKLPLILAMVILMAGCSRETPQPTPVPTPAVETPTATDVPTTTSIPMALTVNGEGIPLVDYEAEITRLQQALAELGKEMTPEEQKQRVVDNFINELLLAQSAVEAGFTVSDEEIQGRIDRLINEIGGIEKLAEWQSTYGYTDESFRGFLKRSILVAWQRDQIIDAVPTTAEQIHARQLLYENEANATEAYAQLQSGADFASLAYTLDPTLGGDLGWFPRGTLTQPAVEEAVFTLQAGEYTGVIKSDLGYHIVYVIERDAEHPLSVDARRRLQELKLDEWIAEKRSSSTIEVLVP